MSVCLVGFGRIGRVTARLLRERGVEVVVYDASERALRLARSLGFEAHLADASSPRVAGRLASYCDAIATALPGYAAERVVEALTRAGARIVVDVSALMEPLRFEHAAVERGVKLFVDTGFAPGLSNILAMRSCLDVERCERVEVYVGAISERDDGLLGLVASWNMLDLLEEYCRPARAIREGRLVRLDPLEDAVEVDIPGVGVFDALPTDGLRTLLTSLRGVREVVEYTLRYPGHVRVMRMLQRLGLLDYKPVNSRGCSVRPRELLARLLEERLGSSGDRVILFVRAVGFDDKGRRIVSEYTLNVTQSELGLGYPVLQHVAGLVHSWFVIKALRGYGHLGLNKPEEVAYNRRAYTQLMSWLSSHGVHVRHRLCVEE